MRRTCCSLPGSSTGRRRPRCSSSRAACRPAIWAHVAELTTTLLEKSFSSRKAIKYLVNQGLKGSLAEGLHLEAAYTLHYETTDPDAHEGLMAFAEKRKPRFQARRRASATYPRS